MAKKIDKKNIRKLTKTGGHTITVSIPIEIVRDLKWKERQKVVVERKGDSLIVRDWEK